MMRRALILSLAILGVGALVGGALALDTGRAFLWNGSHWEQVSTDGKIGYVFGIGNLADFETAAAGSRKPPCVSRAFVNELKAKKVMDIVQEVDRYYQENPSKLDTPVIEVVLRRCTALCPPETPSRKK